LKVGKSEGTCFLKFTVSQFCSKRHDRGGLRETGTAKVTYDTCRM